MLQFLLLLGFPSFSTTLQTPTRSVIHLRFDQRQHSPGYRYVLNALSAEGLNDLISDMNARDDVPGYGYQWRHGATALTERWQALPLVSNNHFMLGHLLEWFYEGLPGIRQHPAQQHSAGCLTRGFRGYLLDERPRDQPDTGGWEGEYQGVIRKACLSG